MKIAIFTDTFTPEINGVTNTLEYLTAYLTKNRIDYRVFAPEYGGEPQEERVIRTRGIRPAVNPASRLAFPSHRAVCDAIAVFGPDVIHITTELGIGWSGLRAARELGIPVVMSYHTNFDRYLRFYNYPHLEKAYWGYMRWFHSFASVNLCPSRDTLRDLEERGFVNPAIWSRGIDTERFSPEQYSNAVRESLGGRDRTVFLYVGRLAREKGLDVLAQAAQSVSKSFGDRVRFVFTGDGPYKKELMDLGLPNAVFTGFKQGVELAAIYASSDIFVFPSGTETFGNVALEAMSSGLPVICADSGGVTDFTSHLNNAYIFQSENPMSLVRGMEALLLSRDFRTRVRDGGMHTASQRSWDHILDGLLTHYETAAASAVHPSREPLYQLRTGLRDMLDSLADRKGA